MGKIMCIICFPSRQASPLDSIIDCQSPVALILIPVPRNYCKSGPVKLSICLSDRLCPIGLTYHVQC